MNDNFPIITTHGNFEIYIEDFQKILEFCPDMIITSSSEYKITVQGENLIIECVNSDDLKIIGKISNLKIEKI